MVANRRTIWLAVALVVVIAVSAVVWTSNGSDRSSPPSAPPRTPAPAARAGGKTDEVTTAPAHVKLEALEADRGEPVDAGRNPFRFQVRQPPPSPPGTMLPPPKPANQGGFSPMPTPAPTGPPPPPPIPLKFIGLVTQGTTRVAVLSDGRSPVSGKEGDIILGQYRILKIGNESIEMSYVDGRGRQTIRLTGQ